MQVQYKNDRIRRQVSSERELKKKYGSDVAKQVKKRILQLEVAENLEKLCSMPGNWKPLRRERKYQYSARLQKGLRLIIRPDEPEIKEDGTIDQKQVKSITVIEITDYHQEE